MQLTSNRPHVPVGQLSQEGSIPQGVGLPDRPPDQFDSGPPLPWYSEDLLVDLDTVVLEAQA